MNPIQNMRLRRVLPALTEFTVVRGLRWLAIAGMFLLLTSRVFASVEITDGEGVLEVSTFTCPGFNSCFPPLEPCHDSEEGAFAAPIGNPGSPPAVSPHAAQCSTTDLNGHPIFAGPVDGHGEYAGDAQSMTLIVSASGSADAPDNTSEVSARADCSPVLNFTVTGEATDVPISVSITAVNCLEARATLSGPGGTIGEITADNSGQHGSFPPGPLSPGDYSIELSFSARAANPPDNFNFDFSATITVGEPCGVSHHIDLNGQDVVTVGQCGPIQWNNPAGGAFQTATNWDPQRVPGANDTAIFGLQSAYSVNVGTASTDRLEVLSGGTVTFTNADYSVNGVGNAPPPILIDGILDLASGNLSGVQGTVGQTHTGNLLLESGATLSLTTLSVGGVVEVHDGGLLDVGSRIDIGPLETTGSGILTIGEFPPFGEGGGIAQTSDCVVFRGSLGVHGQGTTGARLDVADLLSIGGLSDIVTPPTSLTSGLVTGGAVVVAQNFALGDRERSSAAFLVISGLGSNGQPSLLNVAGASPSLLVSGAPGKTLLEVTDGAMLISSNTQTIGSELFVGKVQIHGKSGSQPSTWLASDLVGIGSKAVRSELVVEEGGVVTGEADFFLAFGPGELGRVTVSGSDSSLTAGMLVGSEGDGELTVSDGGLVTSALGRVLSHDTGNEFPRGTGLVTIQGTRVSSSEWHVTETECKIGTLGPATLRLEGETIGPFSVGGATLRADVMLTVGAKGFVRGNGTIISPKVVGGNISPDVDIENPVRGKAVLAAAPSGGSSFLSSSAAGGIISIEGDYEQTADGKLTIDVDGVADGEFDVLHVTGNATLGGTLEMLFPGDYLPKTGDSFNFLKVDGTISGDFAEITFPQLAPGFLFDTAQVQGGLLLTALNDAVLAPTFLLNISTRLQIETGDNVLIGGFILQGSEAKTVLIRAIGPSLEPFGVVGALADPTLELHDDTGEIIGQNDNWRETQPGGVITEDQFSDIFATGIPPLSLEESAIIATLDPGAYTAIVAGASGTTGIGLMEIYDLGPAATPAKLGNISSRGFVQTGDNVMIGGFIIGNQTSEVLVRGIGPSLIPFGIDNALTDPLLELHDGNGDLLASNDNWRSDQEAEIEATDLAPNDDLESAILRTLAPGAYTAILRGVAGTTGVGLVEAYNLD